MSVWEYKTIARDSGQLLSEEQLNKFGAAGFELAGLTTVSEEVTVVGHREKRVQVHYFFKRPKASA